MFKEGLPLTLGAHFRHEQFSSAQYSKRISKISKPVALKRSEKSVPFSPFQLTP